MSEEDQPAQPKSCIECTRGLALGCMTFGRMKSDIGVTFAHHPGDKEILKEKIFQISAITCPDFTTDKVQSPWV